MASTVMEPLTPPMTPPPARLQPAAIRGKTVRTNRGHVWEVELRHLCWVIAADQQAAAEPAGRILAQHVLPFLAVDPVELQYVAVQEQDAAVEAALKDISRLSKEIDTLRTKMNTLQMQQQVERTTLQVALDDRRESWLKAQRDALKTWLGNVKEAERAESTAAGLARALSQELASFRDLEAAHAALHREVQTFFALDVVRDAMDGEPVRLPSLDPAYAELGAAVAVLLGVAKPPGRDLAGRALPPRDAYAAAWATEIAPRGWRSLIEDMAHLDLSQLKDAAAELLKVDQVLGGRTWRALALDGLDLAVPRPADWARRFRPRAAEAPAWEALARWVRAVRACVAAQLRSPRADTVWVGPVGEAEAELAKAQKELVLAADAAQRRANNGLPRPVGPPYPVGVAGGLGVAGGVAGGPGNAGPGARGGLGLLGGPRPLPQGPVQPQVAGGPGGPGIQPVPMPIRPIGMPGTPNPPAADASWLREGEESEQPATVRARREMASNALEAWLREATPDDRAASSRAARRAAQSWAALQQNLTTAEAALVAEVQKLQALDLDQLPALGAAVTDVRVTEPDEAQTIQELAREPRVARIQVDYATSDELRAKIFLKHGSLRKALELRSDLEYPGRAFVECATRISYEEFLLFVPKALGESVPLEKMTALWRSLDPNRATAALPPTRGSTMPVSEFCSSNLRGGKASLASRHEVPLPGAEAAASATDPAKARKVLQRAVCLLLRVPPVEPAAPGGVGPVGYPQPIRPVGNPIRPTRKVEDYSAAWNAEVQPRGWHGLVELLAPRYAQFPAAVQLAMLLRAQPDLLAKLQDLRTLSAADWEALRREGGAWHGLGRWLCAAYEFLRLLKRRGDAHSRWEGAVADARRKLARTRAETQRA